MKTKLLSPRKKRHIKIRQKISGTASLPRLNIFRSNTQIFAQIIDDQKHHTIVSASTKELSKTPVPNNVANAEKLGTLIAEKALEKNITEVVFDRGGYAFHGRVKAFAESCRKAGLKF